MEGKLGSAFKHVYKSPIGNIIILIEEDFLTSLSFLDNTKNINITKKIQLSSNTLLLNWMNIFMKEENPLSSITN